MKKWEKEVQAKQETLELPKSIPIPFYLECLHCPGQARVMYQGGSYCRPCFIEVARTNT